VVGGRRTKADIAKSGDQDEHHSWGEYFRPLEGRRVPGGQIYARPKNETVVRVQCAERGNIFCVCNRSDHIMVDIHR
jgi:hypothetical protein